MGKREREKGEKVQKGGEEMGENRSGQKETGREGRENNRREETGEMHLCNVE